MKVERRKPTGECEEQGEHKESLLAEHKRSNWSSSCVTVARSPGAGQTSPSWESHRPWGFHDSCSAEIPSSSLSSP